MEMKTITIDKTTTHKKKKIKKLFRKLESEVTDKTEKTILKFIKKCLLTLVELYYNKN